ncbi:MAG: ribosome-associated translation inhibitor RaiA [Rhodovibrionaceae bacterium]
MQLSIQGRQIDVGDAFRHHVEGSLTSIFDKYFGDPIEASVTLSRVAHLYHAGLSVHIGRGMQLQASGEADEVYPAYDMAAERLAKRLRRYKRRLRDHHKAMQESEVMEAQQYILAAQPGPEDADAENDDAPEADDTPVVIAEMAAEIPSLTVSEAVMRLDLAEAPALLFRNRAHGGLNMIYRRPDGNLGWVDPRGNAGGNSGGHAEGSAET